MFLDKFILLNLIFLVEGFSSYRTGSSHGLYKEAIYNKKRNEYFWKSTSNMIPISKFYGERICFGWEMCEQSKIKEYDFFRKEMNKKGNICFSWNPLDNRDDVRGLVVMKQKHREIEIIEIIFNPYLESKDEEYLTSDIEQIKFSLGMDVEILKTI